MAKAAAVKAIKPSSESFEADDEGWLDKLIADEEEPDRATLWRLGSWAIAAVIALTLGLMSGQLPDRATRAQLAEGELASQAQRIEGLARETQRETRRIAAAVETLNSDRDRLFGRITTVEQNLDSVTGSIAKQARSAKPAEPAPDKPAERAMAPAPASNTDAATPRDPAPSPVATTAAAEQAKETPPKDAAKDASKNAVKDAPIEAPKTASPPSAPPPTASSSDGAGKSPDWTGKKADRSDGQRGAAPLAAAANTDGPAPNDAQPAQDMTVQASDTTATTVPKPAPGQQVASTPPAVITATPLTPLPDEVVAAAAENDTPVAQTQFGLDLGGAGSMAGLRALWSGVRKSHPSQFAALRPVLAIRQGKNGLGLQVHVVAGPIADAAAAARLCAVLAGDERECETAIFDGQRLLPDTDDVNKKPVAAPRLTRRKQAHREPPTGATPAPQPADGKTSMLSFIGVR